MPRSKKAADQQAADIVESLRASLDEHSATMTISSGDESVIIPARTAHVDNAPAETIVPDGVSDYISRNPNDRMYIPLEEHFGDYDFKESTVLTRMADQLIQKWPEFRGIEDAEIEVLWKKKGGKSGGKYIFGKATKPSGMVAYYSHQDFIIWIAADHTADAAFSNAQMEALIYHELKHCWYEIDENENSPTHGESKWALRSHDAEVFHDEILRYGMWTPDIRALRHTYEQLALEAGESQKGSDDVG